VLTGKFLRVFSSLHLSQHAQTSIGYCNNQSRTTTSPAHVAHTPAQGIQIVSTQGTIEVYESSHYR